MNDPWMLIGGIALAVLIAVGIAVAIWRRAALGPRLRRLTNEQGWVAECPACRVISPAGDAGRIRVHGADREMLCLLRCPSCAKRTMMRVYKRAPANQSGLASAHSMAPGDHANAGHFQPPVRNRIPPKYES